MNMMVSTAAVAAAAPVAAAPMSGRTIVITDLHVPPTNAEAWSGIAMDGTGQRWIFSGPEECMPLSVFREDRSSTKVSTSGQSGWAPVSDPDVPDGLVDAARAAIQARRATLSVRSDRSDEDVYAAIERHRQAWLELDAAVEEEGRCETKLKERGYIGQASVAVPLVDDVNGEMCVTIADEDGNWSHVPLTSELLENVPGNVVVRHCYRRSSIDEVLLGPKLEGARQVGRRQLASAQRRYQRARRAVGLDQAQRRTSAAHADEGEAQRALALVIPQTAAGARAVITYWCEHARVNLRGELSVEESDFTMSLLTSLHAAFGNVAAAST